MQNAMRVQQHFLKFEELYRRKIKKNEYDKYMFDNFMTPAISEYKSELI